MKLNKSTASLVLACAVAFPAFGCSEGKDTVTRADYRLQTEPICERFADEFKQLNERWKKIEKKEERITAQVSSSPSPEEAIDFNRELERLLKLDLLPLLEAAVGEEQLLFSEMRTVESPPVDRNKVDRFVGSLGRLADFDESRLLPGFNRLINSYQSFIDSLEVVFDKPISDSDKQLRVQELVADLEAPGAEIERLETRREVLQDAVSKSIDNFGALGRSCEGLTDLEIFDSLAS